MIKNHRALSLDSEVRRVGTRTEPYAMRWRRKRRDGASI